MLDCSYSDYSIADLESHKQFLWNTPEDFSKLNTKRRRRCCSCEDLINIGADCLEFERVRQPNYVETNIYGEDAEINIASWWMCGECGEIYLNLQNIGYCLDIQTPMMQYMEEYHEITGFKTKRGTAWQK